MTGSGTTPDAAGLVTVGHGKMDAAELARLLAEAGIRHLVDIRRFPGSRRNPETKRDFLAGHLPAAGIGYSWEEHLGGRRRLPAGEPAVDTWWTVEAFRAYAAYTRTGKFREALGRLLALAAAEPVAVMCSESVWWRCHRRLIADVVVLEYGLPVTHLMPGGRLTPHRTADGARLDASGRVVWDGG
jgi:uncharacterized protein (DUF488 family)